jgi:streptogramin lyase
MRVIDRALLLAVFGLLLSPALVRAGATSGGQRAQSASVQPVPGSGSLAGETLVPAAVEQLVGGEGSIAARAARRASPQAVAARAASRDEFDGLSAQRVRVLAASAFPQLIASTDGGVPALPRGQRIVGYPTDHSAVVSTPSGPRVIESLAPIATSAPHGRRVPLDLRLTEAGGGFRPARANVGVSVPRDLAGGVVLTSAGVSLTPVTRLDRPLSSSAGALEGTGVLWDAAKPAASGEGDLATLAKASPDGFELTSMLLSQSSPETLYFRVGVPAGASLSRAGDGSIGVLDRGATLAVISPVSAEDAEGSSVPVAETLHGHTIELKINLTGDYLYPIAVDPEVNDSQLATTSAGKRSNWEFFTSNAGRFAGSAVYEGAGQEHLETRGIAEYAMSEWAYWGYQTQGISKIYEINTETSAHNVGAKIESFLEFEQPGGAQETKKPLSTEIEGDAEYTKKAATLCAANAGHEECLPAAGQAHNAIHFQQSATASPGGNYHFSDTLTQGIVSIAEPTGTHATTNYEKGSPTLEYETESEGKKVKVTRANVLYGSGSWLTSTAGAFSTTARDEGIGVAKTMLEEESAPSSWVVVGEHNYLEHENACQGVQCYPKHAEVWTLNSKLPEGEDKLRYKAEEAMSGTQSLTTEGLATIKVDATAPHRIFIEGLPYGNELSERPYTLKAHATDGEGSTVASSGVKSLALFVGPREVAEVGKQAGCSVAKGECTATAEWSLNGAELGAGHHAIVIVATDKAGNQARLEETISIRHSTPVALGPGAVDLQSGDFTLGAGDLSLGSGLTVGRNYSSRATEAGDEGPLGPQWSLNGGNAQSLVELVDGAMMLTDANGRQVLFASLGSGAFESPPGDSNLKLTLEENKTTKQKLAYYLEDPAAHTKTKFTLPSGGGVAWVPARSEGTVGTDTMTYGYQTIPQATEFSLAANSWPEEITAGPDGNVWYTTAEGEKLGSVSPAGVVHETTLAGHHAHDIITGVEGNLWYADPKASAIDKLTPSGKTTEYPVPSHGPLTQIAQGPESDIWFTRSENEAIGKMTPTGVVTEYTVTPPPGDHAQPDAITAGPDGNIWFTDLGSLTYSAIWRVTPAGVMTKFSLPNESHPSSITTGPDNNLWFTDQYSNKIGKITPLGVITEYSLPSASSPKAIVTGPDQKLWFTDYGSNKIGKITTIGVITEYSLPSGSNPDGIAGGPDGKLWYTTFSTSKIGTISTSGTITEPTETLAPVQAGVACAPEMKAGCRALKYTYATTTTATGEGRSAWGEYKSRLSKLSLEAFNPATKTMQQTAVAEYSYDSRGELRAEWDPRISPALKTTYGYDEQGHVTAISPPGQEPWIFTYGTSSSDSGTGRLLKSMRPAATTALWNGEAFKGTAAPIISGSTPRVGTRLGAGHGTWSGIPLAYGFQWERCLASQEACTPILGATNESYTAQAADAGHALAVVVTATNAGGSATQTAYMTEPVAETGFRSPFETLEYSLPTGSRPWGITAGPGNMWFTEPGLEGKDRIGKITTSGTTTEYATPTKNEPVGITAGPAGDGSLWFVERLTANIGDVSSSGTFTMYKVTRGGADNTGIAAGPDGDLWFTEWGAGYIGRITTYGVIAGEYALPAGSQPTGITRGPDGNMWFTDAGTSKIGKITTAGVITEYALPAGSKPYGIVAGPDGNMWFTDMGTSKIGHIATTAGNKIVESALPSGAAPRGIAVGADGDLWVAETGLSKLVSVSTSFAMTQYSLPAGSEPYEVAAGPEENIWFTDYGTSKIGKVIPVPPVEGPSAEPEPGTTINYNIPLSGTGLPSMTSSEVAKWGQSDDPVEGTAITASDEPQGWPASGYKRATVYYLDAQGRQVNVAAPSSSPYGAVSTTEYNEFNDPIRTLSAGNRQAALEAGAGSVEKSKLLDTQNTYNGEGAKEGEVEEPGTRLIESDGPQHKITYVAGHEQKEALARLHSKFFYDEGAPGGETYDLQTKKSTLAQLSNEEEVEVRTTKTSYAGQSNLGWKLRAPTSMASYGPEENALIKSATEYNSTTGQITESRSSSAETTLSYAKKFGEVGSEAGKLKAPWGVAVNSEGQLLVVDSANSRVEKFSAEGAFVSSFGSVGSGNGQLKEPQGIALDSAGNVWVADTGNNRVEEFSSAGAFVKTVGSLGTESGKLKAPSDLVFDSKGNLWVADTGNSRVEKFNKEGVYSSEFGSAGSEPGKLKEPEGIVVDSGEHVWVADTGNNRIQEFSTTGSLLKRFGSSGSGEGQLNTPIDLKIDAQGNLWTADSKNNRAEAFTPTGGYVTQVGFKGTGAGQLSEPKGIAFGATGKAWVVDSVNNRLEQWSKGPNAHDQKTVYFSAAANTEGYAACGSRPEWAGLVCETLPAKQPELFGLPSLPVTAYTYNMLDEPETITETFGSSTRTRKETYDAAGRRTASETTASSGKALPQVAFSYNSEQGVLEKETAEGKSLTSEFNRLGQLTKYTDADGNVAKYSYAGPESDYLLTEVSDSSAGGTSSQYYDYDPTTKLPTKVIDSAAGTFTAAYDTEGKLTSVSYPYGMCEVYAYNSVGEATSLQYTKSSNCSESEPGIFYQDSGSSSIRGEMLGQSSSLASETYTYDPSGRLMESQETPAGEGCTVRAYTYDEETNRATSTTRTPGTGGVCQTEGGTVEAHNYDEANRLADSEVGYDSFGNVTKLPAADAEGHELTSTFYVDNAVATQTQSGLTNEYKLDPEGRTRELISGSIKTVDHYDGPGEAVAWSETPEKWVRNIAGVDGTLLATQTNGETPILQLHDLEGNVVATIGDKAGETKLLSTYNSSEFGVPKAGKAPPKFAYLGAVGLESSFSSGVITYGATSYVPQTGRALQSEAVEAPGLPGGSGAGAPYTSQEEPWNMQGAAREAAEAPGLEAAREQAALEAAEKAAEGTVVDPWEQKFYNLKEAQSKAESFFEAESMAVVLSIFDLPSDFLELLGKVTGDALSEFDDAYKWLYDAGDKLMKCANNNRRLHHCRFEWDENEISGTFAGIEWFPAIKWPNFTVEPIVYECKFFPNGSHECPDEVHINTEL